MNAEQVFLERLKVSARTELSPQVAHDTEVLTWVDQMSDRLVVELRSHIYGKRLGPIVEESRHDLPRSPWQAYRLRWFPYSPVGRLILRVRPVKYITATARFEVARVQTFPDNQQVFPKELGSPVMAYLPEPPVWT